MITYSTNHMGPISRQWFRDRGLTCVVTKTIKSETNSKIRGLPMGAPYEIEIIHTDYMGGRIDIRGLDEEEYYCGQAAYGLDPMKAESWGRLTKWFQGFRSEELIPYDDLIALFEKETNHSIEWWIDEKAK